MADTTAPEKGSFSENLAANLSTFTSSVGNFLGSNPQDPEAQNALRKSSQYGLTRDPWRMYLRSWLSSSTGNPKDYIAWSCNPAEVSWDIGLRATHQKNLYGTVMHVWYDDSRDTFFDEIRLNMKFNSGSIMPVWIGGTVPRKVPPGNSVQLAAQKKPVTVLKGAKSKIGRDIQGVINSSATQVSLGQSYPTSAVYTQEFMESHGLVNFYDFLNLVDAAKMTDSGEVNYVIIEYKSQIFPNLILKGLFEPSGVKFVDSSENPAEVGSWTAEFLVYDCYPRLTSSALQAISNENLNLIDTYRNSKFPPNKFAGAITNGAKRLGKTVSDMYAPKPISTTPVAAGVSSSGGGLPSNTA